MTAKIEHNRLPTVMARQEKALAASVQAPLATEGSAIPARSKMGHGREAAWTTGLRIASILTFES
ncbi:MAG: hypothetical protein WD688_07635 [Candidatus Binatia bacterium]